MGVLLAGDLAGGCVPSLYVSRSASNPEHWDFYDAVRDVRYVKRGTAGIGSWLRARLGGRTVEALHRSDCPGCEEVPPPDLARHRCALAHELDGLRLFRTSGGNLTAAQAARLVHLEKLDLEVGAPAPNRDDNAHAARPAYDLLAMFLTGCVSGRLLAFASRGASPSSPDATEAIALEVFVVRKALAVRAASLNALTTAEVTGVIAAFHQTLLDALGKNGSLPVSQLGHLRDILPQRAEEYGSVFPVKDNPFPFSRVVAGRLFADPGTLGNDAAFAFGIAGSAMALFVSVARAIDDGLFRACASNSVDRGSQ